MRKVLLEQDKCVASGQCVVTAIEFFDQRDEDGVAVLLQDEVGDDQVAEVEEAVLVCPAAAIRLAG